MGGANSELGVPTNAEWEDNDQGTILAKFENGHIAYDKSTGETIAYVLKSQKQPSSKSEYKEKPSKSYISGHIQYLPYKIESEVLTMEVPNFKPVSKSLGPVKFNFKKLNFKVTGAVEKLEHNDKVQLVVENVPSIGKDRIKPLNLDYSLKSFFNAKTTFDLNSDDTFTINHSIDNVTMELTLPDMTFIFEVSEDFHKNNDNEVTQQGTSSLEYTGDLGIDLDLDLELKNLKQILDLLHIKITETVDDLVQKAGKLVNEIGDNVGKWIDENLDHILQGVAISAVIVVSVVLAILVAKLAAVTALAISPAVLTLALLSLIFQSNDPA